MQARTLRSLLLISVGLSLAGCQLFQPNGNKPKSGADDPALEKQGAMVASATKPQPLPQPTTPPPAANQAEPVDPSVQAYLDAFNASADKKEAALTPNVSGPQATKPPAHAQAISEAPSLDSDDVEPARHTPVAVPLGAEFAASDDYASYNDSADFDSPRDETATNRAPRIERVSVRAGGENELRFRTSTTQRPRANQPLQSAGMPTSLKGFLDEFVRESDGGTFRQQLDERILRVLAGDDASAARPMSLVTNEQQKLADSILASLQSVRDAHMGDPALMEDSAITALRQLRETLRALEQLSIPTIAICWKVDGFGNYQEFSPAQFVAGRANEMIVYTEIDGFISEQRSDDWYYANFELTTSVHDRIGNTVATFNEPDILDKCRTRRVDCFVPHLITLPASLAPGDYVVKVTVVDKIANRVTQNRTPIKLVTSLARG